MNIFENSFTGESALSIFNFHFTLDEHVKFVKLEAHGLRLEARLEAHNRLGTALTDNLLRLLTLKRLVDINPLLHSAFRSTLLLEEAQQIA